MNKIITPKRFCGKINAPPSKSFAHRILICAFLSALKFCKTVKVVFSSCSFSNDVTATVNCLETLGANIKISGNEVFVSATDREKESVSKFCVCNAVESGSTLRFLIPIASALGVKTKFIGSSRLMERPIAPLITALNKNGAGVSFENNEILVTGKLSGGKFTVDNSLSSQYVTGILLALAFLGGGEITVNSKASFGYVDITLQVLKTFGVEYAISDNNITINSTFKNYLPEILVEGDWSNASFFLCAGVIGGEVSIGNLNPNSVQGDSKIIDVIKSFNGNISYENGYYIARKSNLTARVVDIDQTPDIAQIVAVMACFSDGVTVLKNVDRLKVKETDRVNAIIHNLTVAGITCKYENGCVYICGNAFDKNKENREFCGFNDHRAVMSSVILASLLNGESTVTDIQAVAKSYPDFFESYDILTKNQQGV